MRFLVTLLLLTSLINVHAQVIRVGAKHFNEGYVLGEALAQLIESEGYKVERKFNLGGTAICYEALRNGAIDLYPEYTGSLAEEILKSERKLSLEELNERMRSDVGMEISRPFGFNNTYALAVSQENAERFRLKRISDLRNTNSITTALSYEFLKRKDGWANLKNAYDLQIEPVGIEHGLAYQALVNSKIDLTDVYSTDGEIDKYNLFLLEDDLNFFPNYQAVAVYNASLSQDIKRIVSRLDGIISEKEMQTMNAEILFANKTFREVAQKFLLEKKLIKSKDNNVEGASLVKEIGNKTLEHLALTGIALGLAISIAVPLGVVLYIFSRASRPVLYLVGLLQTIPSIALLALAIPLLGIGKVPAIVALFLYALLPILRNTTTGLASVDPVLKKVATGMGMTRWQQLRWIEVPLAMPSVLAGIRTAAVITIGTATLAAFIGAGGLGEFIVTGLALNNTQLILQGAIPAALLAIVVEFGFELAEKILLPAHLRTNM